MELTRNGLIPILATVLVAVLLLGACGDEKTTPPENGTPPAGAGDAGMDAATQVSYECAGCGGTEEVAVDAAPPDC